MIDGYSTERVIAKVYQHSLSIRSAESKDCGLFWNWVNEEGVRKNSYNSEPVPFENHKKWFEGSLKNEKRLIFVISDFEGVPLGQVRFDIQGTEAEIDLSIDKNYRGFGLASHIICKGALELIRKRTNLLVLNAFIKKANSASSAAFRKAGFAELGTEIKNGVESIHMVLKINDKDNKNK
jgi:RimJ/RimL family protein N-acetyltransferase